MNAQVRLGRVAGIPLGANWSLLVVFGLFAYLLATSILPATVQASTGAYWAVGLAVAVLFFGALLAHELAHALLARHYGVQVKRITLWMLGGVTELAGEPATARQHLAVAAAGPLTSLAAGLVFGGAGYLAAVLQAPALLVAGLIWLAGTNGLLAVFNLLPGAPLDGGRVLQSFLWMRWGDRDRATLAAARAGRGLGAFLVAAGAVTALLTTAFFDGLWLMLIGWFVLSASAAEQRAAGLDHLLAGLTVADVMSRDPVALPAYQDLEAVLDRVTATRQELFPVVDFQGRVVGVLGVDAIARIPGELRPYRRVGELAAPVGRLPAARPDEQLTEVMRRVGPATPVLVFEAGELVGIITPADLGWTLRRAALGRSGTPVGR